jgi:hypothetical protein
MRVQINLARYCLVIAIGEAGYKHAFVQRVWQTQIQRD